MNSNLDVLDQNILEQIEATAEVGITREEIYRQANYSDDLTSVARVLHHLIQMDLITRRNGRYYSTDCAPEQILGDADALLEAAAQKQRKDPLPRPRPIKRPPVRLPEAVKPTVQGSVASPRDPEQDCAALFGSLIPNTRSGTIAFVVFTAERPLLVREIYERANLTPDEVYKALPKLIRKGYITTSTNSKSPYQLYSWSGKYLHPFRFQMEEMDASRIDGIVADLQELAAKHQINRAQMFSALRFLPERSSLGDDPI